MGFTITVVLFVFSGLDRLSILNLAENCFKMTKIWCLPWRLLAPAPAETRFEAASQGFGQQISWSRESSASGPSKWTSTSKSWTWDLGKACSWWLNWQRKWSQYEWWFKMNDHRIINGNENSDHQIIDIWMIINMATRILTTMVPTVILGVLATADLIELRTSLGQKHLDNTFGSFLVSKPRLLLRNSWGSSQQVPRDGDLDGCHLLEMVIHDKLW